MAVNLSPVGGVAAQFFDNDGNVLSGGKIYTYTAGSSTPAVTYTTAAGVIQHSNPIILDSAGRVPGGEIWLTDGIQYKFVINNSIGTLIGTYDNIIGINSNFLNYLAEQEIQTATAGQTVFTLTTTQYQPGTNTLSVFVDGVNQYGPGAQYAYTETSSTVVTFVSGLHVGASVKFTTTQALSGGTTSSSLVTYQPAGSGAVETTVQAKLRQYVNIKDFGAVGNGSTDDTAAIQATVNYVNSLAATNKPTIYVPAGRYLITSPIQLYADISICGEPRDIGYSYGFTHSSEILAGTSMGAMFDVTGSNIYVGNLGFYANTNADYALKSTGSFGRMSGNTFENLAITLCNKSGIYLQNCGVTKIRFCQISNCLECGIDGQGWGDADIDGCFINTINVDSTSTTNAPSSSPVYGVGIRLRRDSGSGGQTGNVNIRGGKIEFCRVGILMNAAQGINITGVNFDTCRKASIFMESDSGAVPLPVSKTTYNNQIVTSIQISGNRFLGGLQGNQTPTAHIIANHCRYVTIVGNGFKRADDAAADFYGTYPTQGQDYGIWLYNSQNCTVVGNDLYGAAITYGVVVQNSTVSTAQHTIYSNTLDGTDLIDAGTVVAQPSYGNINFVSGAGPVANSVPKAWARVDISGASPVVVSSFNVTSVTSPSAGAYVVNFTNALPDDGYMTLVSGSTAGSTFGGATTGTITVYATGSAFSVACFND